MVEPATIPRREYDRWLTIRTARRDRLEQLEQRLTWVSGGVLVAALFIAWAVFDPERLAFGWMGVPVLLVPALAIVHDLVIRARARADRAVHYWQRGIDRLESRWAGAGDAGTRFSDPDHPYARDLDLFGAGSLFELISAARTGVGATTLAGWLTRPAPAAEIRARQEAVRELAGALDLREAISMLGDEAGHDYDPQELVAWAQRQDPGEPSGARLGRIRSAVALLVTLQLGSLVYWIVLGGHRFLFLAVVMLQIVAAARLRSFIERIPVGIADAERELSLLAGLLARIEACSFRCVRLRRLAAGLEEQPATAPSRSIRGLERLIVLLDSRENLLFRPLSWLLAYKTQLCLAVAAWRRRHGAAVAGWLESVGEFEALSSLAGYHYERPNEPFPDVLEDGADDGLVFDATSIGHPLIPADRCVRNDVLLDDAVRLLVVSGSNMAGKSTLLRAIGINAVLALAGAPVRAERLRISCLQVGASIHVEDSLRDGVSGFYAELRRLRQLTLLAAGDESVLFLLDEIMQRTNSHDRRIGSEAVLRTLLRDGASGLITTHDLALTEIVDSVEWGAANVHFVDRIENGVVRFDYRLRPGVVAKSNAVELMRSIGLEI